MDSQRFQKRNQKRNKLSLSTTAILLIVTFMIIPSCFAAKLEVSSLGAEQRKIINQQEGFIISENEFVEFLDQYDCQQLSNMQFKISSNINFNGVPVTISSFVAAECLETDQSRQRKYLGRRYGSTQSVEAQHKRNLVGSISATQSTISGDGTTSFVVNTSVTATVTAKDSAGTSLTSGGSLIFIQITNTCTKGYNIECYADGGALPVMTSSINSLMTDNGNGAYSYTFQVARPGTITIQILLYKQGGVYNEFFPNSNESGNNVYNGMWSTINIQANIQDIYPGRQTDVSGNFYFKIKGPISGSVTFTISVDDTATMYINNSLFMNCGCCGTYSQSYTMTQNQYYDIKMTFYNGPSYSTFILQWSYSGQSSTIVPSTSLYYPAYVSNSPFNVTVTCPENYLQTTTGGIPQCIYLCGNNKRDNDEECDDGNVVSGDGCSDKCIVENGYKCTGGSSTTKDTCSRFTFVVTSSSSPSLPSSSSNSSPTPSPNSSSTSTSTNSTSSKQSVYTISTSNQWLAFVINISVGLCFLLDLVLGFLTDKYPAGIYISIEHLQLLAVLPITGSYFTKIVKGLFRMMRYALLGFDFVDFWSLFKIDTSYSQNNETLEYLGFASGSSIVNLVGFISVGVCILVADVLVYRMLRTLLCTCSKWTCPISACRDSKNWMCISFYIRYLLLGYLLILVSSMDEINNYSVSGHKWSWSMSVVLLFFQAVLFVVSLVKWLWTPNDEEPHSELLDELIKMMKPNPNARFYPCMFLIHRMLICALICIDNTLSTNIKLILLICIQGVYLVLLVLIRPFSSVKANISKIICETSVFVLIVLMYVYQNSSDWTDSTESMFMCIIMGSSCVPCIATAVALLPVIVETNSIKVVSTTVTPIETPISKLKYTRDDVSRNQITMFEETKKDLKNEISPDQKSLNNNEINKKKNKRIDDYENTNGIQGIHFNLDQIFTPTVIEHKDRHVKAISATERNTKITIDKSTIRIGNRVVFKR